MSPVPYNKLLTNPACSSRTGEYWPSVVFVRTSRCSVPTVTTSGQYSPVRPSRSVSKRLVFYRTLYNLASLAFYAKYRRIPKITALVTFECTRPVLSCCRYLRVAGTFGRLKNVCTVAIVADKLSGRATHESKSSVCAYKQKRP